MASDSPHLQDTAKSINTGTADSNTSRALVVFNLTGHSLSGVAVFRADMAWPAGTPLPPVAVRDMDGQAVSSALTDLQQGPDRKGRADCRQLTFTLRFAVRDVPPQGWRTYIAAYTSAPTPATVKTVEEETAGLTVIETLRHSGDLPPTGTFQV